MSSSDADVFVVPKRCMRNVDSRETAKQRNGESAPVYPLHGIPIGRVCIYDPLEH